MIEKIPNEKMEPLLINLHRFIVRSCLTDEETKKKRIFARLDELFAREKPPTEKEREAAKKRAQEFGAAVGKIQELIGDDKGWASEEEMIEELMRERRAERARLRAEMGIAS